MKNISTLLLALITLNIYAFDAERAFKSANDHYQKKEYLKALNAYNTILKNGYSSSELFFNQGNAYYKLDSIPQAILSFEKAKKINPGDDDISFNLEAAYKRIPDKQDLLPVPFYEQWLVSFASMLTVDGWGILSVLILTMACILFGAYFFAKSRSSKMFSFFTGLSLLLLFLISYGTGSYQKNRFSDYDTAIIFKNTITAKSEPSGGTDLFILHEGSKVKILEEYNNWFKIKIGNGQVGWLPASALRVI